MILIETKPLRSELKSGYMVTVSSIGDNQQCKVEVAASFFYMKNRQMHSFLF